VTPVLSDARHFLMMHHVWDLVLGTAERVLLQSSHAHARPDNVLCLSTSTTSTSSFSQTQSRTCVATYRITHLHLSPIDRPFSLSALVETPNQARGHRPGDKSILLTKGTTSFIHGYVLLSSPSSSTSPMHPHYDHQAHLVIKSESPPLLSVPVSSIGQPHSRYVDTTGSQFRFGPGDHNALPPFSFMSQSRSSTWPQHAPIARMNSYPDSVPASLSLPPVDDSTVLTLTDEYDDGEELGDLPSASGSAVELFHDSSGSSSKTLDKAVRRRSSKGASRSFLPIGTPNLTLVA